MPAPASSRVSVSYAGEELIDHLQAIGRKPATVESYESLLCNHLAPFFASRSLDSIGTDDLEAFIRAEATAGKSAKPVRNALGFLHSIFEFGLRKVSAITVEDARRFQAKKLRSAKPKSVRNWMSILHSILEYGVESEVLGRNVAASVRKPKASRRTELVVLSGAEIQAIRDACPDTEIGRSDATMILVAARSGLRQSELVALRWKHVDWNARKVRVAWGYVRGEHKAPKSGKARALPLPSVVEEALTDHFKHSRFNGDDDLVFPHPVTGKELDRSKLLKRFKDAVVKAGLRDTEIRTYRTSRGAEVQRPYTPIKFHDLRHAFATHCAAAGIPMRTIMEWIGHEDQETLMLYAHYAPSDHEADMLDRAIEQDAAGGVGALPSISPQTPRDSRHGPVRQTGSRAR